MLARGGKKAGRSGATLARGRRALPQIAVLIAALALFGQLLALPYHHPHGRPDSEEVVALLKATFGDAVTLCVGADDDASNTPKHRHGQGHGGCPLCQFGAQTVLFAAPVPSLPEPVIVAATPLIPVGTVALCASKPWGLAQPRAPPFEI